MSDSRLNLFSFTGKTRVLHLTWMAFFMSFMVWFNHAPLMSILRETFGLSDQEVKVLLIMNVALTIPARILVGMLVDRFGPRLMFSGILMSAGVLSVPFALAESFEQLAVSRLLLGFVGAGFVVGTRMIGEWFPARQTGAAQGIYGGWGNFGSAGSAMALPALALWFGGEDGWRYAILTTAVMAFSYGIFYYFSVSNTPKGSTYFKPKKMGAMEITSKRDLLLYLLFSIPVYGALALLTWKLGPANMAWLSTELSNSIYIGITAIYLWQAWKIIQINKAVFTETIPEMYQYSFKQVVILDLAYMVTFGSELALVSMLPLFYIDTFGLSLVTAGLLAAIYPVMNLIARPAGGVMSDRIGRKLSLTMLFSGIAVTFLLLGQVSAGWAIVLVVGNTILCGLFSKGGSGAVYAMVPLIQRRMTGQVAGMVGAYGNVGGLIFLTVLSFTTPQAFFMVIGFTAFAVLLAIIIFLDEPKGQTAEVMPDGSVQMIDVT
ncbi:MAG: MFS transporter [Gammaproteobacteria bacterium]|nr:MFS transporter [Gammaproteobacteria bacterium]MBT3724426.1 MFS transporter [Gammaproteobacteria bacterium]MBT4078676.1 MFS transporter [Gammaproteobacteria bacterium]MBT4196468.1 MFS transporter [Gammaproteobacteria bacterium]MBT4450571.1 MFS transporter [Gammaproteobacteria bacterium]